MPNLSFLGPGPAGPAGPAGPPGPPGPAGGAVSVSSVGGSAANDGKVLSLVGGEALVQPLSGAVAPAASSWTTDVLQIGSPNPPQNRIMESQVIGVMPAPIIYFDMDFSSYVNLVAGEKLKVRSNYQANFASYSDVVDAVVGAQESYVYVIQPADIGASLSDTLLNISTVLLADVILNPYFAVITVGADKLRFIRLQDPAGMSFIDSLRVQILYTDALDVTLETNTLTNGAPVPPPERSVFYFENDPNLPGKRTALFVDDGGQTANRVFAAQRVIVGNGGGAITNYLDAVIHGATGTDPVNPLISYDQLAASLVAGFNVDVPTMLTALYGAPITYGLATQLAFPNDDTWQIEFNNANYDNGTANQLDFAFYPYPSATPPVTQFTWTEIQPGGDGVTTFTTTVQYLTGLPVALPVLTCGVDWLPAATLPLEAAAISTALNSAFTLGSIPLLATPVGSTIVISTTVNRSILAVTLVGLSGIYNLIGSVQGTAGRAAGAYQLALGVQASWAADVATLEGGNIQLVTYKDGATPALGELTVDANGDVVNNVPTALDLDGYTYWQTSVGRALVAAVLNDVIPMIMNTPILAGSSYVARPAIILNTT